MQCKEVENNIIHNCMNISVQILVVTSEVNKSE